MTTTDPRVDAYIAKSADFAQPILESAVEKGPDRLRQTGDVAE
jgi:hypothetical protein